MKTFSQAIFCFFQKFHHAKSLRQLLPKGSLSKVRDDEKMLSKNALNIENEDTFLKAQSSFEYIETFQVFDDIAVEITMAILQFLNSKPSEEYLFRMLKALSKFVYVSFVETVLQWDFFDIFKFLSFEKYHKLIN